MANFDESSTGYNWETEGVYQIEKNDPVEGGPDGISNRQGRQLTRRTRDLHSRLVALKTQADGLIDQVMGGNVDAAYNTLLKLQNKLRAVESAINGDNGDALIETLQEVLSFINDHKSEIESLVNTYVKKTSVADNLTTTSVGYVLSANQGKVLKGLIDTLNGIVNGKETLTGSQQKADAALAAAKDYTKSFVHYDYVVDSDETLRGLTNNDTVVNVMVKKGVWNLPKMLILGQNIHSIIGELGATLKVPEGINCELMGNTLCSLENLVFDFNDAGEYTRGISRFKGVVNCVFKLGDNLGVMMSNREIMHCHFISPLKGTDANVRPFFAVGFWVGNINNCLFEGGKVSNAYDLRNCTFKNTKVSDVRSVVNSKFLGSTIASSSRIVDCEFYGYDGVNATTSVVSNCYGVRGCNIQSGRTYYSSYASPGNDRTATCGPTAAGGFNFSNYGNQGDPFVPDKSVEW